MPGYCVVLCEFSTTIQCEAYTADVDFDKSTNGNFYDLQIKKFGAIYSEKWKKMMPVDQRVSYKFINGAYVVVAQKGENYIPEDENI